MSQAAEWAEAVRQAEARLRQRRDEKPAPFDLGLEGTVLTFSIDDQGSPQVAGEGAPLAVGSEDLLALAAWIRTVFADAPAARPD